MDNRPTGRKKNITGQGKNVQTNREVGGGPVGSGSGYQGRPRPGAARPQGQQPGQSGQYRSTQQRAGGSKLPLLIILAIVLLGGGGGLGGLFGGGSGNSGNETTLPVTVVTATRAPSVTYAPAATKAPTDAPVYTEAPASSMTGTDGMSLSDLLSGFLGYGSGSSTHESYTDVSSLQGFFEPASPTAVPTARPTARRARKTATPRPSQGGTQTGVRAPYTAIRGNGRDVNTIMIYMCGTDLESRSAMATRDLQEMLAARFDDHVNLIIATGGCSSWRNNLISNRYNQIWRVQNGKMKCLKENDGTASMTDPDHLAGFIQYCKANFPADRYHLIFWDHGSGSVSGYGYDEKNQRSGSMTLSGISKALRAGGVRFDMVGFDACLMATVENALMLSGYGDYMVASEETEPGYGWYYTDWLNALGRDPSMDTVSLGKQIVNDFVTTSARQAAGQKTTLSVVDLARFSYEVPGALAEFSRSISGMLTAKKYQPVSKARYNAREFAQSNRLDQVDLTDLALKLGTDEGAALADAIGSSVVYNRTSSNMTNAYGLSIYFPYQKMSHVDKAVNTFSQIGMDESYIACIRQFASLEASGQAVSGGSNVSPYSSLSGSGVYSSGSYGNNDLLSALLGSFLGGDYSSMSGLSGSNTGFLSGRSMSDQELTDYLSGNLFDSSALYLTDTAEGKAIRLTQEQWALVNDIQLNLFIDNGKGYIDMGMDALLDWSQSGDMLADTSGTWVAIDGQPVPYYQMGQEENGVRYGYVPALLDDQRVRLIVVFAESGQGYLVGALTDYQAGETETVAKSISGLPIGAKLTFVCDFYTYDGEYQTSYTLGDTVTVGQDTLTVSDVYIAERSDAVFTYRFTDIYNQQYWSQSYRLD